MPAERELRTGDDGTVEKDDERETFWSILRCEKVCLDFQIFKFFEVVRQGQFGMLVLKMLFVSLGIWHLSLKKEKKNSKLWKKIEIFLNVKNLPK